MPVAWRSGDFHLFAYQPWTLDPLGPAPTTGVGCGSWRGAAPGWAGQRGMSPAGAGARVVSKQRLPWSPIHRTRDWGSMIGCCSPSPGGARCRAREQLQEGAAPHPHPPATRRQHCRTPTGAARARSACAREPAWSSRGSISCCRAPRSICRAEAGGPIRAAETGRLGGGREAHLLVPERQQRCWCGGAWACLGSALQARPAAARAVPALGTPFPA